MAVTRTITAPPRWLSTDLRDGNQALIDPMDGGEERRRFFKLLDQDRHQGDRSRLSRPRARPISISSAALSMAIAIPEDVIIQGLTQSRDDLIETTFASMAGAKRAIVHLYNAISPAWRKIVFQMDEDGVIDIARNGARNACRAQAAKYPETDWHFEYSPETFSTAEIDLSVEDLRRGDRDRRAVARKAADPQSAGDGRSGDAQYLCRPDRIFLPPYFVPRQRRHLAPHP